MSQIIIIHPQLLLNKDFALYGTFENSMFLAKDVAEWIDHPNTSVMLNSIDEDEKGLNIVHTLGGPQEMWLLTEDVLYKVLMQSHKPIAKQFKKQVKAILKENHQHRAYIHGKEDDDESVIMVKALLADKRTLERKNKLIEQQQLIKAKQPKVLFADSVTASDRTILVREFAKVLKQNGVNIGEKRLFVWLRESDYLIKKPSSNYNLPTQRSMDFGLLFITQSTINRTARMVGKDKQYFLNKFLKAGEIA